METYAAELDTQLTVGGGNVESTLTNRLAMDGEGSVDRPTAPQQLG
jgi:hypothetical protein